MIEKILFAVVMLVITTLITEVITFFKALAAVRQARKTQEAVAKIDAKLQESSVTLTMMHTENKEQMLKLHQENQQEIEVMRKENGITHSLSNSAILMQMQAVALLARKLANYSKDPRDVQNAKHAESVYEDHRQQIEGTAGDDPRDVPQ